MKKLKGSSTSVDYNYSSMYRKGEPMKHTLEELQEKQALPLELKIQLTRTRIRAWIHEYGEDGVYVSFSGGKDSTVLLDLVRNEFGYKNVKAMFVDVPTQYPELRQFVKTFDNVDIVKPKKIFFKCAKSMDFLYSVRKLAKQLIAQENT